MKNILTILFCSFSLFSTAQMSFDDYFIDKTMRFDFMFAGNKDKVVVYPVEIRQEEHYAGSFKALIDEFNFGNLRFEIRDKESAKLIYSRGWGSLFQEWQTTEEAGIIEKSFYEVIKFPYPKKEVSLTIKKFEKNGKLSTIYNTSIDPENYFILKEPANNTKYSRIAGKGDPHNCVDIAFLAEGYTKDEMQDFRDDVARLSSVLFSMAPYKEFKENINIWAVEAISEESGTDIPGERIYKNTALNSNFYTFDLARYLTSLDLKSINDYAAVVPHDNIIVLVNSEKYGGGGMYNYYSCTTSDHSLTPQVFTHELGHGFAGLADEYYSSAVAYDEFYPLDVEPWETNITTMVDFDSKWKKMISKDTPTPTPAKEEYAKKIGLFEGGGYSGKGIYRPQLDCRMKSNEAEAYCAVCEETIRKMILFHIK